jgi:hypothetical protein
LVLEKKSGVKTKGPSMRMWVKPVNAHQHMSRRSALDSRRHLPARRRDLGSGEGGGGGRKEGSGRAGLGCTGEEPDGEEDEEGGAEVAREDLELGEAQRHVAREVELRRRVGVGGHCRLRQVSIWIRRWREMKTDQQFTGLDWISQGNV